MYEFFELAGVQFQRFAQDWFFVTDHFYGGAKVILCSNGMGGVGIGSAACAECMPMGGISAHNSNDADYDEGGPETHVIVS